MRKGCYSAYEFMQNDIFGQMILNGLICIWIWNTMVNFNISLQALYVFIHSWDNFGYAFTHLRVIYILQENVVCIPFKVVICKAEVTCLWPKLVVSSALLTLPLSISINNDKPEDLNIKSSKVLYELLYLILVYPKQLM